MECGGRARRNRFASPISRPRISRRIQRTNMTIEQPQQEANQAAPITAKPDPGAARVVVILFVIFATVIGALIYTGILSRKASASALARETREDAVLAVAVVHPKRGSADEEVVLP